MLPPCTLVTLCVCLYIKAQWCLWKESWVINCDTLLKWKRKRCWYLFTRLSFSLLLFHLQSAAFWPQKRNISLPFDRLQNGPQKLAPRNTPKEDWQEHIILLSYFFQLLMFFWPHYLLYTPFHLFYSHPLHLCSSLRLSTRYSLSNFNNLPYTLVFCCGR